MKVEIRSSDYTDGFSSKIVRDLGGVSSSISLVAFTGKGRLFVRFANGSEYVYCNVRYDTLKEILTSNSIGKAFRAEVINNPDKYPYSDVSALTESEIKMLGLVDVTPTIDDSILEVTRSALSELERNPLF